MGRYAVPQDRPPQEFRECSLAEVANELGCSGQLVERIEKQAHAKVRAILDERGYTREDLL